MESTCRLEVKMEMFSFLILKVLKSKKFLLENTARLYLDVIGTRRGEVDLQQLIKWVVC